MYWVNMYPYFLLVLTAYIDNKDSIGLPFLCYEPELLCELRTTV